jgi:hypothetical protein
MRIGTEAPITTFRACGSEVTSIVHHAHATGATVARRRPAAAA